jgi:2'-hydroxyisoflavone reductase
MRILVLGGTGWVRRHAVAEAVGRGHAVTTFARGTTHATLPPAVEQLRGDRDLGALAAGTWDIAIDCDSYDPQRARTLASAALLRDRVERYAFLSSMRAYASFAEPPAEDAPRLDDPADDYYGARKAACERVVEEIYGAQALPLRLGVLVGPGDPLDRYTWWCVRLAAGGRTVAPAEERPMQLLDVRDLGAWLVQIAESGANGAFNVAGPHSTLRETLETTRAAVGGTTELVWVDDLFLQQHEVTEWYGELPLWLPDPAFHHLPNAPIDRAVDASLTFRPLEETARDTLSWARAERGDRPWEAGLGPEREAQLLG